MLLALDMGNTNILAGVYDGEELVCTARVHTAHWRTADEWAVLLRDILSMRGVDVSGIDGVILSSVAWPVTDALRNGIKLFSGIDPFVVGPGLKTGLHIAIDNPAQLGSDMVCNAVAALAAAKPPLIIFDMGTATTMSVLDQTGKFIGGAILPGLVTSLEALSAKAAQLPKISVETPDRVIGRNTVDCMRSGAVYGTASMLDGLIERTEEELGAKCAVLATGGLSERIANKMRRKVTHAPALLLEGLRLIYRKNTVA
ncbi:MAG: type III pantothenate kinase [Oscillospiraceae bacterium]|jgi:type III pantothenate kinase|nr:type III pantothenate kinase [Oscillospiraceae bacterium]